MTDTRIDTTAELAAINALIEPWLFVDQYGLQYGGTGVFAAGFPPYNFEGFVKPDGLQAEQDAAEIRRALLARAEGGLEALADAGWQLTEYPRMEFTGVVDPFAQTLGGDLAVPSKQALIKLTIRFAVDKPKPR